ncbi:hypothetical protein cypCar_00028763 [Cyprinus carpio]|nr:hypothetical protein cypCar_00028763 [Cyprinus carpio]
MSGPPSHRRPGINVGSILLTPQENEVLSNYLGKKCTSLSSAVVQVYGADRNSSWVKKCCGVACLVKDSSQRSYFIRVFDMKTCQIGLNFASEEEARRFKSATNELQIRRGRKTGKFNSISACICPPLHDTTVSMCCAGKTSFGFLLT